MRPAPWASFFTAALPDKENLMLFRLLRLQGGWRDETVTSASAYIESAAVTMTSCGYFADLFVSLIHASAGALMCHKELQIYPNDTTINPGDTPISWNDTPISWNDTLIVYMPWPYNNSYVNNVWRLWWRHMLTNHSALKDNQSSQK